ncbi:MAG: UDP-3-O-acyl-N-acetylglucosamine deacetylase [Hyphomicrobiales bacterium]|nr:UDP-3-O-acyl-N-acetylglucosamine deacetylase [Hyphomicrobiales bacterium]
MKAVRQTTLRDQVVLTGIGVHSGLPTTVALHPAEADSGIRFLRTGLGDACDRDVPATLRSVAATEFATVLGDGDGPLVSTAEHVLAALRGLGVDNALIEVDAPEVPIMDGSAADFVRAIDQVGIEALEAPRRYIRVLKPVSVVVGLATAEFRPYPRGFRIEATIDFDHPQIGRQSIAYDGRPESFRRDFARARTFGFMRDVARLWSAGYALGASLENTLVVSDSRVLNPEGTRYPDEFVRHKLMDAIGDLALAGAPILGLYRTVRGGHKLNHAAVSALLADTSAWMLVEAEPARPVRGHGLATAVAVPAYAPDVS